MSFKQPPKTAAKAKEQAFLQGAAYASEKPVGPASTAVSGPMADLHVKLDASEMKALKIAAIDADVTVSTLVRRLIADHLAKR